MKLRKKRVPIKKEVKNMQFPTNNNNNPEFKSFQTSQSQQKVLRYDSDTLTHALNKRKAEITLVNNQKILCTLWNVGVYDIYVRLDVDASFLIVLKSAIVSVKLL
jgi:hypothetical protein